VQNRALCDLIDWWLDKRGRRAMPSLCDIDAAEIRSVLAKVWLCDYVADSVRFRYRLAGEEINDFWRCNLSGKYLDEVVPLDRREAVTQKSRMVANVPAVVHDRACLSLTEEIQRTGERVILPLSDDGRRVNALIGATHRNWIYELEFDPFVAYSETTTVLALFSDAPIHFGQMQFHNPLQDESSLVGIR